MTYLPPYLYRPDICPCHLCVENRAKLEVERVANVLNTWPVGGLVTRKDGIVLLLHSNGKQGTTDFVDRPKRKQKLKAVKGAKV